MSRATIMVLAVCTLGSIGLLGLNLYELGIERGKAMVECPKPRIERVNWMDWYSGEELVRIGVARKRMEKVK